MGLFLYIYLSYLVVFRAHILNTTNLRKNYIVDAKLRNHEKTIHILHSNIDNINCLQCMYKMRRLPMR